MSVGIIVPDIANPFFAELVRGAEGPLDEAGFVAFVGSSDNEIERELRYLESFSDRQIDGLIVAVTAGAGSPVSSLASQLAAVAVDRVTATGWATPLLAMGWRGCDWQLITCWTRARFDRVHQRRHCAVDRSRAQRGIHFSARTTRPEPSPMSTGRSHSQVGSSKDGAC